MINWMYYPKTKKADSLSVDVVQQFEAIANNIASDNYDHSSNTVLEIVRQRLEKLGFIVEKGKKDEEKIHVPVLYGMNGHTQLAFDADAYHPGGKYVIEVEAGRAVVNYQFLKDFFEACTMSDAEYLCIAVRNTYKNRKDFEKVCNFFDVLFLSNRLGIPLKGILIIGY